MWPRSVVYRGLTCWERRPDGHAHGFYAYPANGPSVFWISRLWEHSMWLLSHPACLRYVVWAQRTPSLGNYTRKHGKYDCSWILFSCFHAADHFTIFGIIVSSIKCQKTDKCSSRSKVTFSNDFICPNNKPKKPKTFHLRSWMMKKKQQMFDIFLLGEWLKRLIARQNS